jgi:hypothetical protein
MERNINIDPKLYMKQNIDQLDEESFQDIVC